MDKQKVLILGDSHARFLMNYAKGKDRVFQYEGGGIASGKTLQGNFFQIQGKELKLTIPLPKDVKSSVQDSFHNIVSYNGKILSTIGFNTHRFVIDNGKNKSFFSKKTLEIIVSKLRAGALKFYQFLHENEIPFTFITSPKKSFHGNKDIYISFEQILVKKAEEFGGTELVLPPEMTNPKNGLLYKRYWAPDISHGNALYQAEVLNAYEKMFETSNP